MKSIRPASAEYPQLVFCAGGIGSGKSSLIRQLQKRGFTDDNTIFISFDHFVNDPRVHLERDFHDEKMGENKSWFLSERAKLFAEAEATGKNIVVETHLDHTDQLRQFTEMARADGYQTMLYGITLAPDTFMRLRWLKDKFTDKTPLAMQTQKNFLAHWPRFPAPIDHAVLFERVFEPPQKNGVRPITRARRENIANAWGVEPEAHCYLEPAIFLEEAWASFIRTRRQPQVPGEILPVAEMPSRI